MHLLPIRRARRIPVLLLIVTCAMALAAVSFARTPAHGAAQAGHPAAAGTSTTAMHTYALSGDESTLLIAINRYRRRHHRTLLVADKHLDRAARWMAADLGKQDQVGLSHTDSLNRFVGTRLNAFGYPTDRCTSKEDLAAGKQAPAAVLAQWKGSKPHRRNLLASGMHAVGLAQVQVESSRYGWYWVIDIGSCVSQRL